MSRRFQFSSVLKFLRFLHLFAPLGWGINMYEAAKAFETPPRNQAARRHAMVSICSLLASSVLLLAAALIDTLANDRPLAEKTGVLGILCLIICVHSGLCYKDANSEPPPNSH